MSRRALVALAAATVAATPLALWAVVASKHPVASKYALASLGLLIGLTFIASGVVARLRRPDNRTGLLMVAVGFGWYLSALSEANNAWIFTFGSLVGALSFGFLIHLVVAFPSGRLESRLARAIALAGYTIVIGANAASVLFSDLHDSCGVNCPRNHALVYHDEKIARALIAVFALGGVALACAVVVLLVRRWRHASVAMRRALLPVFVAGCATLGVAAVDLVASALHGGETAVYWVLLAVFISVPVAFLFGLLRSRLTGSAVARVLASHVATNGTHDTQTALREALGDPDLRLAFWYVEGAVYVDPDGTTLDLSAARGQHVTELTDDSGGPLAAVIHDVALLDEPRRLSGVLDAARLGLQRDKLHAELRARLADLGREVAARKSAEQQLKRSRSRLVAAAGAERRRLERNLHDGAQQRLVSVSLTLRLAQSKLRGDPASSEAMLDDAANELTLALEELRELARGLHPAVLTERGLEAAIRALADRAPFPVEIATQLDRRPPEEVEVALFYVVSESLTNIAKYAQASFASVTVAVGDDVAVAEIRDDGVGGAAIGSGTGLTGLADRVDALDGRLEVTSPAGGGTTVRAAIPIAR